MNGFRFLHSGDLHLGRRFGMLPEDLRGRLIEARHDVLPRLAQAARDHGARDILLAGDTFDTETPSDPVWRQALAAMAADPALRWWILPGNHDSLAAETLWPRVTAQAPANVRPILTADPVPLSEAVTLLPAPLPHRHAGRDLTAWMDTCPTPEGVLRLGLAHGPIAGFGDETDEVIDPTRADRAGLAYLALGDWHGARRIGARTAYAGTPEPDAFGLIGAGTCMAVTLGATAPEVKTVPIGRFSWPEIDLTLVPGLNPGTALDQALPPPGPARRDILARVLARGRCSLPDRLALDRMIAATRPEFGLLDLRDTDLTTEITAEALDTMLPAGALRHAAEALAAEAGDPARAQADRRIAEDALNRLAALVAEAE
ncbi:MAG: metallophosphoesterase [Paracoccaceae bacterium]